MITFDRWAAVCKEIASLPVETLTAAQLAGRTDEPESVVVVKHDVEALPRKALETARIENEFGIRSTFYFHGFFLLEEDAVSCMQSIQKMGHEIGYHYDVLDRNDGNFEAALAEFETDLERFAKIGVTIETVCPHGNPLKKRQGWNSNKDFFKDRTIRDRFPDIFDIVNDIDDRFGRFCYISDAGFQLKRVDNIRDNDKREVSEDADAAISFSDLLEALPDEPLTIISIHSHRLETYRITAFFRRSVFRVLKMIVRPLLRIQVFKKLFSKLFALSKRF